VFKLALGAFIASDFLFLKNSIYWEKELVFFSKFVFLIENCFFNVFIL